MSSREIRKRVTDNPILDEIIYQCQNMIRGIVLKDEERANNNETLLSIQKSDLYAMVIEGKAKFPFFTYTFEILSQVPSISRNQAMMWAKNNALIPDELKPTLLELAKKKFLENYEEQNNYYRMLYGLPNIGEAGIHLSPEEIDMIGIESFDVSKYVHEMDDSEATILYKKGVIDVLLEKYPDKLYLKHLGVKRVEPYIARKMPRFSLLYLPPTESTEVFNKFRERIEINRVFILKTMYSEAYKFESEYYDRFIMIMIIVQSLDDMVALAPEYIISRELFDLRTIQYIFEACGVKFFPEIPLKFQKRLVKNLNRLIKYKSCDKNMLDIADLFGFDNLQLFKYYLTKIPYMNEDGSYRHDTYEDPKTGKDVEDLENNYKLSFLKVPLGETYDDYIRDEMNYVDYDETVREDIYWNGPYSREYVREEILKHNFNVVVSKYISVDTVYSLTELTFELVYFINMIMYSGIDVNSLTVAVPEVSSSTEFPLIDLIILLYSLMYLYNGTEDNIIYDPVQAMAVLGFNFEVDMNKLESYVQEHGYTLEELGVSEFRNVNGIYDYKQLIDVYTTNKKINDHLIHEIVTANDKDIYDIYMTLYNSLMVTKINFDYFRKNSTIGRAPKTYKEFLSMKNANLYNIIDECASIITENERRLKITEYINYIVEDIYTYIDRDTFRYVFNNIPTVGMDYIRTYLFKVLNFFKSYKVDMIHTGNIYYFDDRLQNNITVIDRIKYNFTLHKGEKIEIEDYIKPHMYTTKRENIIPEEKIYFKFTHD